MAARARKKTGPKIRRQAKKKPASRTSASRRKKSRTQQKKRTKTRPKRARPVSRSSKKQAARRSVRKKPKAKPRATRSGASGKKSKKAAKKARSKQRVVQSKAQQLRQRERLKREKERERERKEKQKERERSARERQRARDQKERERQRKQKEREKQKERKAKEAERLRQRKERDARRLAERKAREQERARRAAEKEAEKAKKLAERERLREEARRKKEEERLKREAEREAYRKAKEAEQEKLRAEKEAARRALEGKIARQSKRAQRAGLGRGTTRVYRPEAIPNQSGTRRVIAPGGQQDNRFANLRIPATSLAGQPAVDTEPLPRSHFEDRAPPPAPAPPPPEKIEDRYELILRRLSKTSEQFQREYQESFDMSWIYHDSALEGVVYTFQELKTAIDPNITVVPDSSLQPVCEEIRRHKAAIDLVRDLAERKRVPISVDIIKKLYLTLHPDEGDIKTVKYRKDIPQHRLYFHEYSSPDKIAYRVRQVIDWLSGPEPKKLKSPVRIAARAHFDLLRVFPFHQDSGKVARLLMNVLLLRAGYPPAIIHSTERQRYYEALRGALPTIVTMVNESIENGLTSIEKLLDEEGKRKN